MIWIDLYLFDMWKMSSQVVGVIGLMRLFSLFVAASVPVVKVLLLTALGSLLALDHINVLSPDARKHLNTVRKTRCLIYCQVDTYLY